MKTRVNKSKSFIRTIAAVTFSILLLAAYPLKAVEPGELSKKELKELIKNAKTPAQHQQIAAYYRSEAARQRARAAEHATMIAETQMPNLSKFFGGRSHCEFWVKEYTQEAEAADAKAALHERMAAAATPIASRILGSVGE